MFRFGEPWDIIADELSYHAVYKIKL